VDRFAADLFGLGGDADRVDARYGVTPRAIYDALRACVTAVDADVLLRPTLAALARLPADYLMGVTDVRTQAEADGLRGLGAVLARIVRADAGPTGPTAPTGLPDVVLRRDAHGRDDVADLARQIKELAARASPKFRERVEGEGAWR
jgi:hypothetical protein